MRTFNRQVSNIWITSEHAFGVLKARFPSLKEMGPHRNIQDMYKAIEALMIIHNICIDWGDKPEDTWDIEGADDRSDDEEDDGMESSIINGEADVPAHKTERWLLEQGREKRLSKIKVEKGKEENYLLQPSPPPSLHPSTTPASPYLPFGFSLVQLAYMPHPPHVRPHISE